MNALELVGVNKNQCEKTGRIIKGLKFRKEFLQREFISFNCDKETKMRAYFYSAAICHQTHSLLNRKKDLHGWDYLENVFLHLAKTNSKLLNPDYLTNLSISELIGKLKILFSDDGNPNNCTLGRLEERAGFLIEIGKILKEKYNSKVTNLIELSNGFLINDGNGLYELLEQFESYSDPLKKKTTFFIELLIDSGIIMIKDPENFVPVMDYHIQRVLLRMGCVEIFDKELKEKLLNRKKIDSDEAIRNACVNAIRIISPISGYEIIKLNDFFWPLGRSCCMEKVLCIDKECNKNPCTFELTVDLPGHEDCVFNGLCKGSVNAEYRKYWQPIVETHYY